MENAGKTRTEISNNGSLHGLSNAQPAGDLPLDTDKYKRYMEDSDLTEEQQAEFLQALWSIMKAFVDLGFDANSIQNFIPELTADHSDTDPDQVELGNTGPAQQFEKAVYESAAKGGD